MKVKNKFVCVRKYLAASAIAGLICATALAQGTPKDEVKATLNTGKDGGGSLIVEAHGIPPKVPLFFTASSKQIVTVNTDAVRQVISLTYNKIQGDDEVMSIVLNHKSDIKSVTGDGLKEWSVRELNGIHYLDVRMLDPKSKTLKLTVVAELLLDKSNTKPTVPLMTLSASDEAGAGFNESITIIKQGVEINVTKALGCTAAKTKIPDSLLFLSNGESDVELNILKNVGDYAGVDLRDISMQATINPDGKSALVTLTGELHVRKLSDEAFTLVRGFVALSSFPEIGAGEMHVEYSKNGMDYGIICQRLGSYPIKLQFAAPISADTGWSTLSFKVPNGAVVPLKISQLDENIEFRSQKTTILDFITNAWQGVLPASGICSLQWKTKPKTGDGELFYTSEGISEVSVGSGLMHTSALINFKVLQGKMDKVVFDLTGSGEVVSVTGTQVASWKVTEAAGKRVLECVLKSETSSMSDIRIASQFPLGKFPTKVEPLTLTPQGTMRHSGFIRVSNKGAVRVETSLTDGLMQLSPDKFPGKSKLAKNTNQQIFVYRFPSAERKIEISADQIISEVAVSHITTYEMSETDRVIMSDIEIDITEAGLREWSLMIPEDYSVSGVSSANMVDHVLSTTVESGRRALKVLFKDEVVGRQLIRLRLEKNLPAAAGEWSLPTLTFPGVKNIRGDIGILSANGWKMQPVATSVKNLDERPLAYFPKNNDLGDRLKHAYRTRSADWTVKVDITAMGQSIQSDLLHLYHLKEGILEAKILAYYFVIGAPANEWKLKLPASAENVSVEGQNVRTWERDEDGETLTVTLNQPILGTAKLLVTYEEPMNPHGGKINIGSVTPIGVQSESGFIHLVSSHQVKMSDIEKSESLLKISPLEMPSEHQVLTSTPSVAAWQYAARPYTLSLHVETLELVNTLDQAVGAATLNTRITNAGEVVTNAKFLVNTRGKKALRIQLPAGNKLWTAKADGELINARVDGEQLILPLPPTKDPNRYRTLEIRYGGMAENPTEVTIGPPVLSAPLTIAEWKVIGDNHLTPTGGNVKPLQMQISSNGFKQLRQDYGLLGGVLFLLLGGIFLLRKKVTNQWLILFGNLWIVAAVVCCVIFGSGLIDTHVESFKEFDVVAPVVSDQEVVRLELANHASGPSILSGLGMVLTLAGIGILVAGLVKKKLSSTPIRAAAVFAILLGCLMHVGGAAYFYFVIAILGALLLFKGIPKLKGQWDFKLSKSAVVASLFMFSFIGLQSEVHAAESVADSIVETWKINEGKLTSTQTITWEAEEGESLEILSEPAVLLSADGAGFRVIKVQDKKDKITSWKLIAEESGVLTAVVRYQKSLVDGVEISVGVPSGLAAMKSLSVIVDQQNWQITSAQAVHSESIQGIDKQSSGTKLTLMGLAKATVSLKPMPRDRSKEILRFLAEVADIYVPSPGVLDGRHRVKIKPLAGQLEELVIEIPSGLMVGDVAGSEIDTWRFDAKKKTLTVTMQRPQTQDFELTIMTQQGLKAYPQDLVLESILVRGAATTVGEIGYGFGEDSQPDNAKVTDLLEINIADFDKSLLSAAKNLQSNFVLHKAYRYGQKRGMINLKVAAVDPEIRIQSQQVIRLTDERMSLQVEAIASITRAGVFELKFYVPNGLTVESINGPALRDWSINDVNNKKLATLFLNGKTMGEQRFTITMLGEAPKTDASSKQWEVPRWLLENVSRQRGVLTLIPDHGIRLRVVDRKHASQVDSSNMEKNSGSLAFRLLQKDWKISLNVQQLDPWITAEVLQQVNLREGLTKHWMNIHYNVEHAVVKQFELRIPGVGKDQSSTVRASGPAVKEIVHLRDDIWQIHLRRGMIGSVPVQIGYQDMTLREGDEENVEPIQLLDSKQTVHYVAVRVPSRLEVSGNELREWRAFDWTNVPSKLQNVSDRSEPSLCYRVLDSVKSMQFIVKRHSMAGTLKLRVASGEIRTMFNAEGSAFSRLSLAINVAEKSRLRISLPSGAELFNVIVNDKSAEVVKEGDAYWFFVSEAINENEAAKVQITYQMQAGPDSNNPITLMGPTLSIPLENIDWFVMLPDGYDLNSYEGGFDYKDTIINEDLVSYVEAYKNIKQARYYQLRQEGQQELDQAMNWSNSGQLDKANAALNRVFNNQAVDAASNEDARVKLERNLTSQAIMGLNTRSQKSYMDNKAMGNMQRENGALEEAVTRNPFFLGSKNFNPNQLGDYMQGNSDEEILAMQRIAKKLVRPQMISSDAGQAVELEILETRKVLHFHKDLHLAGERDLAIEIELNQANTLDSANTNSSSSFGLVLILAIASFLGIWLSKK